MHRTIQKDLHAMITHLEPNILESEVKWALGSTATNKASGGDEIPDELFSYLKKTMLLQCCALYASNFGKLSTGHKNGKSQFSFPSQSK